MVKYGPAPMASTRERLARFAWGSQDGSSHVEEKGREGSTQRSGADQSNTDSSAVSPLPHRNRGLRRGNSLDRLPQGDHVDTERQGEDTEPLLKKIMEAIYTCQTTLTAERAEMSFLNQDMHNVKDRITETEQKISDLEDATRPIEGTVQNLHKEVTVKGGIMLALWAFLREQRVSNLKISWKFG